MITWRTGLRPIALGAFLLAGVMLPPAALAVSLDCSGPVHAHLATPTTTDVYSFSVADGEIDQISLQRVDPSAIEFMPMWRLLDKNNLLYIPWTPTALYDVGPLPATGNPYRIEVEDSGHDGTGDYRIALARLSSPASCGAVVLDCGVPHTGTIADAVASGLWTFTAAEGERIQIALTRVDPSGPRFEPVWRLLDHSGGTVAWWYGGGVVDLGPLTAAGSPYCIDVLDNSLDDTGSYQIELERLSATTACEASPLACGVTSSGSISERLDADLYTFDAIDGEIVEIGFGAVVPSGLRFMPYWRVLDRTGNTVMGWTTYGLYDVGPLAAAGSPYRVEVFNYALDDVGNYRLHLERTTAARECGHDLMAYGAAVTRRISEPFDCDLLGFRVISGQSLKLFLDPVDPSDIRFDPYWRVLDKDGSVVISYGSYSTMDIGPLAVSGNPYRLEVVDGSHDASGSYQVTLNGTDPTSVGGDTPRALALTVSPNPVHARGWVTLEMPSAAQARLELYDIGGRRRATLVDGEMPSGRHPLAWNTGGLEGGVYYWRCTVNGATLTRRAVVLD